MSNYRDYLWTTGPDWQFTSDNYCLALIGGGTPNRVLDDLGARQERLVARGLDDAGLEGRDLGDDHDVNGVDRQIVAVADIGEGWTLLIQIPGFIGISGEPMSAVIETHEVVAHGADRFVWWSGGAQQITFEPLIPDSDLSGVLADRQSPAIRERIIELIGEVGGIELDQTPGPPFNHVPGSFALAERLTGLRITPELLSQAVFTVAVVALDRESDHDPALDRPVVPLTDEPPLWMDMIRLHEASVKLTLHGTMIKTSIQSQPGDEAIIEFWRKHRCAWRLADVDGAFAVTGRRGELWFRKDGILSAQWEKPVTTDVHPPFLIEFGKHLRTADLVSAVPETARGVEAEVAQRAAWEFEIDDAGQLSTVAFDAETGVALRLITSDVTYELTEAEIGIPLDDALFEGP